MSVFKSSIRLLALLLCAGVALQAEAQLRADVCRGQTRVVSQQQTGTTVDLEVEVTIEDCDGVCIGSVEYDLVFAAADGMEIQWHMTETWDWRSLDGPFTLNIQEQALPDTQLKEVKGLRIGRCSCSTVITNE